MCIRPQGHNLNYKKTRGKLCPSKGFPEVLHWDVQQIGLNSATGHIYFIHIYRFLKCCIGVRVCDYPVRIVFLIILLKMTTATIVFKLWLQKKTHFPFNKLKNLFFTREIDRTHVLHNLLFQFLDRYHWQKQTHAHEISFWHLTWNMKINILT